ncbi:alpha-N-arabinofuranosidase [Sphingomonas canadensis]|uniref:non-reducing end alpha-L-arabinofuranosidase n=1 Tax=Sphingomonas canadensis TaxID=1219257 RepID=A0ABW3H1X2_9SPHN|nr:alpha-L-arabinofuranosidase C-terminal domain-containing protein [Sphingomonas canadensis]MCW3834711.1 alpha-N-arabinofuranosidase [Sphingomonas canadensis]
MKGKLLGGAMIALLALAGPALAQRSGEAISVTVEAGKAGPKIDRQIFGQFAEHLGTGIYGGVWVGPDSNIPNVRGIRSDVVAALKAIKVPNVRWPGGCFADEYHWRDGIGDPKKRRITVNSNWGGAIENNAFGTHEFFDFVEQIGSEAYVSINVGSGSYKEAADWVAYMTADTRNTAGQERAANGRKEPWKIKFLGIGNESWGCGGNMRPEYYADELKRYARFARNYNPAQQGDANPDRMLRVAVGPNDNDTTYTEGVMKAWKDRDWSWSIEGLSLHSYTVVKWPPAYDSVNFGEKEYAELTQATLRMDAQIKTHSAIMDKYDPEKKVPLIVDEWGVWLAKLPGTTEGFLQQQNTLRDGIIAALNFNIFARHADRVRGANIAQMVNVLQAMILTDGPKMVLTPTYYVHRMYLPFQDATFIPVRFDAGEYRVGDVVLPRIDAVAARGADGKLWLAAVNLDPNRAAPLRLEIPGVRVRSAAGEVLTAPKVNSLNSFDAPDSVAPRPIAGKAQGGGVTIELPAKSVTVLALES